MTEGKFTLPSTAGLHIGRHPSRPERLAVLDSAGNACTWFGQETTLAEAEAKLAAALARLAEVAESEGYAGESEGRASE